MIRSVLFVSAALCLSTCAAVVHAQAAGAEPKTVVLHAAHLLDVAGGKLVSPGEVLVRGNRIVEAGASVQHPAGAQVIDLGGATLMPGLIDAHVHLFLHPGAEDSQTIVESVPERVILAELAAKDDLMAGFTAERDMGTEGAGSADSAVRNAINKGLIPGPRMRVSGNAISVLGGHEDAIQYNPAAHVPGNADYANNSSELVETIRRQLKEGADFIKIYETGRDTMKDGMLSTPYQYTQAELEAAVTETRRMGTRVGVHCTGEPGALFAAKAGLASIDHADYLSDETMRLMKEKQIYAVPTFAITEYFGKHADPSVGGLGRRVAEVPCCAVQAATGGWRSVCSGFGCRAVSAWDAGARDGVDGGVWDVSGGRASLRLATWSTAAGLGRADWAAEAGVSGGCDRCSG